MRTNLGFSEAGRVVAGFKNAWSRWSAWVGSADDGSVVTEGSVVTAGCVVVSWAAAMVAMHIAAKAIHKLARDII
jgi:uncharacterized membrane protein (DUF485 family)